MKKKRNLIIIHLESLNMLNYRMNSHLFPTISGIEEKSLFFNKYYATATSTIMIMSDLAYGGLLHDESCGGISWALNKQVYKSSCFDDFQEEGYRTYALQYPKDSTPDTDWTNKNHRVGINIDVEEIEHYRDYLDRLNRILNGSGEFVLWTCCYTSNISFNKIEVEDLSDCGMTRWEDSYRRLDEQVYDLMKALEKSGHLSDTSLILYGDHGDDLFQHGWYGGLTHAIEPFETLVHTPLLIMDDRLKAGESDVLLRTLDIGTIGKALLDLPERPIELSEIIPFKNEYVISRSLYAAQMIRLGNFEKSYSITDGRYHMMAGNRGMGFYYTPMDSSCHNNLLQLFELQEDSFVLRRELCRRMAFHFQSIYDLKTLERIGIIATNMRLCLKEEVTKLYESGECLERIDEIDFFNIRNEHYVTDLYDGPIGGDRAYYGAGLPDAYYKGKNVVLYGAGGYGKYCHDKIVNDCNIVAWIDGNWGECSTKIGFKIESPDIIRNLTFDVVIVVVLDSLIRQEIQKYLIEMGIDKYRIIC